MSERTRWAVHSAVLMLLLSLLVLIAVLYVHWQSMPMVKSEYMMEETPSQSMEQSQLLERSTLNYPQQQLWPMPQLILRCPELGDFYMGTMELLGIELELLIQDDCRWMSLPEVAEHPMLRMLHQQ